VGLSSMHMSPICREKGCNQKSLNSRTVACSGVKVHRGYDGNNLSVENREIGVKKIPPQMLDRSSRMEGECGPWGLLGWG